MGFGGLQQHSPIGGNGVVIALGDNLSGFDLPLFESIFDEFA